MYDDAFHAMQRSRRLSQFGGLFELLTICTGVAMVAAGLIVRSRLPAVPMADGDTWGYLHPALCWLSGLGFQQTFGRDWLYPALLAGILKVSGNFCAVTYVQRFLGLTGIFIWWLVGWSWLRLLPAQRPAWRWMCFVITLLFFLLYALSPRQALLENTIRPEGMMAFFEMAYLYCLISFFFARWKWRRTGSTIAFGAATLGFSFALLLLKPSWGLSFGFSLLCLVAGAFGRTTWQMRLGPLLVGAIPIVFLFSLPRFFGFQRDSESELFLPCTLVSIHAAQILETNPNKGSPNSGVADPIFYRELSKVFGPAKKNPGNYDSLGFDADYILYASDVFPIIQRQKRWSDHELARACYAAYFRAWRHAPLSMLQKVGNQIWLFLFPRAGDFYSTASTVDLTHELVISRPFLPADGELSPSVQNIYQSYLQSLGRPKMSPSHPLGFGVFAKFALFLAWISFWLQLVFSVALAAICLSRSGRAWRFAGLVIVGVLGATYGNVLTIAVVHSLDVVRYRISYAPGFLLGLAMMSNYLLLLALAKPNLGEPGEESVTVEATSQSTSGPP